MWAMSSAALRRLLHLLARAQPTDQPPGDQNTTETRCCKYFSGRPLLFSLSWRDFTSRKTYSWGGRCNSFWAPIWGWQGPKIQGPGYLPGLSGRANWPG